MRQKAVRAFRYSTNHTILPSYTFPWDFSLIASICLCILSFFSSSSVRSPEDVRLWGREGGLDGGPPGPRLIGKIREKQNISKERGG